MEKRVRNTDPGKIFLRNVARGVAYPTLENVVTIPAWSRGAGPWNNLSPFKIGPVKFEEDGEEKECATFETWWQSFKVWTAVDAQKSWQWTWKNERHVDDAFPSAKTATPNKAWYIWHNALLANKVAVRRPNGRAIPLFAWWKEQRLDVIEARKQLYIPYLQSLYRKNATYQKLLAMVMEEGKSVCIVEPDGPQHWLFPDGVELSKETLYNLQSVTQLKNFPGLSEEQKKVLEYQGSDTKYVPYGHGYVLALTLLEDMDKSKKLKIEFS